MTPSKYQPSPIYIWQKKTWREKPKMVNEESNNIKIYSLQASAV